MPTKKFENITDDEKRKLMHDNPILIRYFFQIRVHLFIEHVLKTIFKVKDYWYRFEWQSRGSPHIHGVLWFSDEPHFDIDSYIRAHIKEWEEPFGKNLDHSDFQKFRS